MKKIFATFATLIVLILSAVAGYAYPSVTHMFFDNETNGLYVISEGDAGNVELTDAGVYIGGMKFSLIKDEEDQEKLSKVNISEKNKYGIGLIKDKEYFENVLIAPYTIDNDGKELIGEAKAFDYYSNSVSSDKTVFFDNFTSYSENELPKDFKFSYSKNLKI